MAKVGAVVEVQRLAMSDETSLASVLRTAWAMAQKLGVQSTADWLQHELKGYPPGAEVPSYRHIVGEVKAMNPMRGLIPVAFEDPETETVVRTIPVHDSIASLEDALKSAKGELMYPRPGLKLEFPIYTVVPRSAVRGVVDTVRTAVLEWAIELEKSGVLGNELLGFTKDEQRKAQALAPGISIGSVTNAVIQQSSPGATASLRTETGLTDLQPVLAEIVKLATTVEDAGKREELLAQVENLRAEVAAAKPRKGKILTALGYVASAGGWAVDHADKFPVLAEQARALLHAGGLM